jgi:hypothetical protein
MILKCFTLNDVINIVTYTPVQGNNCEINNEKQSLLCSGGVSPPGNSGGIAPRPYNEEQLRLLIPTKPTASWHVDHYGQTVQNIILKTAKRLIDKKNLINAS